MVSMVEQGKQGEVTAAVKVKQVKQVKSVGSRSPSPCRPGGTHRAFCCNNGDSPLRGVWGDSKRGRRSNTPHFSPFTQIILLNPNSMGSSWRGSRKRAPGRPKTAEDGPGSPKTGPSRAQKWRSRRGGSEIFDIRGKAAWRQPRTAQDRSRRSPRLSRAPGGAPGGPPGGPLLGSKRRVFFYTKSLLARNSMEGF